MLRYFLNIILLLSAFLSAKSQVLETNNSQSLQLVSSRRPEDMTVREKDTLDLTFRVVNRHTGNEKKGFFFKIISGLEIGMELNHEGHFLWSPDYYVVSAEEKMKIQEIIVEASDSLGTVISKSFPLTIAHKNRPPTVNDLPPFFVKFNQKNTYQISELYVYDEDKEKVVFIPDLEHMPEGLEMSSTGKITWWPSIEQFNSIKEEPNYLKFYVEDQPSKSQTEGRLKLMATQVDLAPNISVIPQKNYYKIAENQLLNIRFYLSDPNGDETISKFDFISNNKIIPKETLKKVSNVEYEFQWQPDFNFVSDVEDSVSLKISFFVMDRTQKEEVKDIQFTVVNAKNQSEEDKKNYNLYLGTLERSWELVKQLEEKEQDLKKDYKKAKKGKKNRSVINASLGASTGLSSVVFKDNVDLQRGVTTIGGTTVMTIGTLEATEVIGKSMKDISTSLNYVIEKKNDIQTKGDIFARNYSDKMNRRNKTYIKDVDGLMQALNLKGIVALELDATWDAGSKNIEKEIKKTFKDFKAENYSDPK